MAVRNRSLLAMAALVPAFLAVACTPPKTDGGPIEPGTEIFTTATVEGNKDYVALVYTKGANWAAGLVDDSSSYPIVNGKLIQRPGVEGHAFTDAWAAGKLAIGGPLEGGAGAFFLFQNVLAGDVWKIASQDSMVKQGVFNANVRELRVSISWLDQDLESLMSGDALSGEFLLALDERGPNWKNNRLYAQQPFVSEQAAYLQELEGKEQLVMAGPYTDGAGGLFQVFKNVDEFGVQSILAEGPMYTNDVLRGRVYRWRPCFWPYKSLGFISGEGNVAATAGGN